MHRLPPWIRVRFKAGGRQAAVHSALRTGALNTVCESAQCPNRQECFHSGTATVMILGNTCTRQCRFCAVSGGTPPPPDPDEPRRVAALARRLGLRHVVITSVTRDDLPDGGAGAFAAVITQLKSDVRNGISVSGGTAFCRPRLNARIPPAACPSPARERSGHLKRPDHCAGVTVEVLTPDFQGQPQSIATVLQAGPDVFNHNLETVERLQPEIRPQADYRRSLLVLQTAARSVPRPVVKSGLMVGLGETDDELFRALADLRAAGCDCLTLGQYLAPSRRHQPVARYVPPEQFYLYREKALAMGFRAVAAGPLVRSSYHAEKLFNDKQNGA